MIGYLSLCQVGVHFFSYSASIIQSVLSSVFKDIAHVFNYVMACKQGLHKRQELKNSDVSTAVSTHVRLISKQLAAFNLYYSFFQNRSCSTLFNISYEISVAPFLHKKDRRFAVKRLADDDDNLERQAMQAE